MGKGFFDDDFDSMPDDDFLLNEKSSARKRVGSVRGHKPKASLPFDLQWYDWIIIAAIVCMFVMIVLNFGSVMRFFLGLTLRIIDFGIVVLILLIIIFIISLRFRRNRRRWY